ncbi:peptidoglycan DD-metalloendopeptidase family protein [Streptomyces sp. NPDC001774]
MPKGRHRKPSATTTNRLALGATVAIGGAIVPGFAGHAQAATVDQWDRIAECESGQRWDLPYGDSGRSSGGVQFQPASWNDALAYLRSQGVNTSDYPQGPGHQAYKATKRQQIIAAEGLLAMQGPGAWTCNARVGFPLQSRADSMFLGGPDPYHHSMKVGPARQDSPSAPPVGTSKEQSPASEPTAPRPVSHTVVSGDTLYGITKRATGDASLDNWKPLYEANRKIIGADPDLIYPGQVLTLPGKAARPQSPKPQPKPVTPAPSAKVVAPLDSLHLSDGYSNNSGCVSRTCGGHSGADFRASLGDPVKSVAAGTVIVGGAGVAYGNHVVVDHGDGVYTLYGHLDTISVSAGQRVAAGTVVGGAGTTGSSSGVHLHFEVRTSPDQFGVGVFLDPVAWLRANGVSV